MSIIRETTLTSPLDDYIKALKIKAHFVYRSPTKVHDVENDSSLHYMKTVPCSQPTERAA